MIKLYPALLTNQPEQMVESLGFVQQGSFEGLHIDIIDSAAGQQTLNLDQVLGILEASQVDLNKIDLHLMSQAAIDQVTVTSTSARVILEYEIDQYLVEQRIIEFASRGLKTKIGLAIAPKTELESIKHLVDQIGHLLFMAVEFGQQGNNLDQTVFDKVRQARQELSGIEFGWDGGVNLDNLRQIDKLVNLINAGSAVYASKDILRAYNSLIQ
ncbi:hypothetical protein KA531_03220 [Candidatus Saccharibacteria bacterium]|nr:hypothetical protein [Candidatus Saccharibacteria bacterium]